MSNMEIIEQIVSNVDVFIALYGPAIVAVLSAAGAVIGVAYKIKKLMKDFLEKKDITKLENEVSDLKVIIKKQTTQINELTKEITRVPVENEEEGE